MVTVVCLPELNTKYSLIKETVVKKLVILSFILCPFFSFGMETESMGAYVDPSLLDKLYEYTMQQNQQYCETAHQPLLIMISGCAGMGKTTLAKLLQERLQLLRFNGDDTRIFLKEQGYFDVRMPIETKLGRVLTGFSDFMKKVNEDVPNKSIIFDESIDREYPAAYDLVSQIVEGYQCPKFVVRLEVAEEAAFARILEREQNNFTNRTHFEQHFKEYYRSYEKFNPDYVDFSLNNEGSSIESNSESLIAKLTEVLTGSNR